MRLFKKKYLLLFILCFIFVPYISAQKNLTVKVGWNIHTGFQEGRKVEPKGGLTYEYLQTIGYIANIDYEYVYGDFESLYEKLNNGDIDVLPCFNKCYENENIICSEIPEVINSLNLYCLDESELLITKDLSSFSKNRIGVDSKSDAAVQVKEWLNEKKLTCELCYYESQRDVVDALENHEIQIAVLSELESKPVFHQIAVVGNQDLFFGFYKGNDNVVFEINQAMNFLAHQQHNFSDKLYLKYIAPRRNKKIILSEREKQFLRTKKEIKIGCLSELAPYCIRNKQTEQIEGILKTVIESIKHNINLEGCEIEVEFYSTGAELSEAFKNNNIDAIFPAYRRLNNAENNNYVFSDSFMSSPMVFFNLNGIGNSRKARIAVIENSPAHFYALRFYPNNELVLYNRNKDVISALKEKKADYFLTDADSADALLNGEPSAKTIFLESPLEICFAIQKNEAFLYTIINRAISKISEQSIHDVINKTLSPKYTSKDFLRDNSTIILIVIIVLVIALVLAINALSESINKEKQLVEKQKHEQKITEELRKAKKSADIANAAKTSFLFNMSHDIRTPMNAIIGFTDLALKENDDERKIKEYLHKVKNSSEHLLLLVNDILDMSRIESGKIAIVKTPENIYTIIDELKDLVSVDASEKKQKLTFTISNVENKNLYCDKLRLNRILLNLISNAMKYTPKEGLISLKVKELEKLSGNRALYQFCVKDNGMGMDRDFLKKIYNPFTRARNSTVSGIQGTGLGMTITKNLVELMDGKIDIVSEEGVGTEVTVSLPIDICSDDDVIANCLIDKSDISLKGMKCLIVDDNDYNREIAKLLFEDQGVIVTEAKDGSEAFQLVLKSKPGDYDLILMDVQMPEVDGIEATKRIRGIDDEKLSSIPIIAMTANAFEEDREKALKAGMNEHVAKPIKMDNIKKIIGHLVQH